MVDAAVHACTVALGGLNVPVDFLLPSFEQVDEAAFCLIPG